MHMDGLMINVSGTYEVGRGFTPRLGHPKDHRRNGINCLPTWPTGVRVGVWQSNLTV